MPVHQTISDPIDRAMIATEMEIAADAWGDEEPETGGTSERTQETMGDGLEGQHEPDEGAEEPEADEAEGEEASEDGEDKSEKLEAGEEKDESKEAQAAEDKSQPEKDGRVPSARLREQTDKARAAESERDTLKAQLTARDGEFAALKGQLDLVVRQLGELQRMPRADAKGAEPTKAEAIPDPLVDPNGYIGHIVKQLDEKLSSQLSPLQQQMERNRVNMSMNMAQWRHGDNFAKAYEAMGKLDPRNPAELQLGQALIGASDPGEEMVQWFNRQETLREVGADPAKYRERIAAQTRESLMKDPEFRKQLLADMNAEAQTGNDGRPRTAVRLPRSLNGAAGGNNARSGDAIDYDDSEQSVADSAWR